MAIVVERAAVAVVAESWCAVIVAARVVASNSCSSRAALSVSESTITVRVVVRSVYIVIFVAVVITVKTSIVSVWASVVVTVEASVVSVWTSIVVTVETVVVAVRPVVAVILSIVATFSIVSTMESVSHADSWITIGMSTTESASVIPASSSIDTPAMSTTINRIEMWTSKVEISAVRVAGIDSEVPVAGIPVERTIEVSGIDECPILPVKQDVAQVKITLLPVVAVQLVIIVDTHQIVEIHLVGSLVLIVSQIQLVSHLVS